jgi:hypothetical protein
MRDLDNNKKEIRDIISPLQNDNVWVSSFYMSTITSMALL